MLEVKRLLHPTDFSRCSQQAFAHALLLARHFGAELHLFHATVLHEDDPAGPGQHLPNPAELAERMERAAASRLAADLGAESARSLTVREVTRRGVAPAPMILEYAEEAGIDMIVMGSHGRRGLGRLLLGSVTSEVVVGARCPVMTVREREAEPVLEAIDSILVPLDFSPASAGTLAWAVRLARAWTARLDLLHVVEEQINPSYYTVGITSLLEYMPQIRTRSNAEMERLLAGAGGKGETHALHVVEGRAQEQIVAAATATGADVVILASHGHGGIAALLGGVTEKVVRQAPCPVLVLPPACWQG